MTKFYRDYAEFTHAFGGLAIVGAVFLGIRALAIFAF